MKKLIAVFLIALMLSTVAFAESTTTSDSGITELMNRLCERWFNYVTLQEKLLSNDILLSDSTLAWTENPTWERWMRARSVASAVQSDRTELGDVLLTPELTQEEYAALAAEGIMVDVCRIETPEWNQSLSVEVLDLLDWNTVLMLDCFDQNSLEWQADRARLKKQTALYNCKWYYNTTNALLISLNDETTAARLWEKFQRECPVIYAQGDGYITDMTELEAIAEKNITAREAQVAEYNNHLGMGENILNNMRYAIAFNEPYFSVENIVQMADMPLMLPLAPWHGNIGTEICVFYTTDAEGNMIRLTTESDLMNQTPHIECVYSTDVEKADVIAYGNLLAELGLKFTQNGDDTDDAAWSRTYSLGSGGIILRWENENASIWNLYQKAVFVPEWYIMLLYTK